jgi:PKD repeat protein
MDVGGLYAYTFDGEAFTEVGSAHDIFDYGSVWGDGTYIYAACFLDGLYAYSFDGEDFTLLDVQHDGDSAYTDVWCDDTYIYTACYDEGIRAYTFNGVSFSLVQTQDDEGIYYAVWGDGTHIYAACDVGIRAYAFDGEDFTLLDTGDEGALRDVWCDDTYIYACGDGLYIYTFDGDEFTYLDYHYTGTMIYDGVYGDGSYIYIPGSGEGPAEILTYQYVFPGESDSVSKNVVVTAPSSTLNADFTFSPSYPRVGQLVTFTDISTGSVTSWSWTFGDGTRVIGKNQQHIYNRVGTFTVTLEVSDGSDTDSVSKTITVREGTATGPHVVFPMDPAYPDNPYTVPEMYDLLHVSDLPSSSEHITIVFLDSGFTPREYDGVDLSMIYGMKSSVYTTTDDRLGHGTWVSYAIKYITDAKLPNADIISYRVFDDSGYCDAEVLLDALDEIEALQPDIVSFSGGAYGDPYDVYSAKIDEMRNKGIIVIVAAGNEGPGASTLLSPGCSNGALGIGAIDPFFTLFDLSDDVVCEWSSRGPIVGANPPKPDFASPGESIIGPWLDSEKVVSGTSMATPLMAGGVAVVYADNKILLDTVGSMWSWLIPNIVPNIVEDSIANTAYQKGDENSYGYGIPDFQAASTAIFVNCIMWLSLFILMILCFVVLCILVSFYFKAQKCRKTV